MNCAREGSKQQYSSVSSTWCDTMAVIWATTCGRSLGLLRIDISLQSPGFCSSTLTPVRWAVHLCRITKMVSHWALYVLSKHHTSQLWNWKTHGCSEREVDTTQRAQSSTRSRCASKPHESRSDNMRDTIEAKRPGAGVTLVRFAQAARTRALTWCFTSPRPSTGALQQAQCSCCYPYCAWQGFARARGGGWGRRAAWCMRHSVPDPFSRQT
jgi:hypothetical protein